MHLPREIRYKNVQPCCAFKLAQCSDTNYLLQRNMAIGVAVLLPFLGVSSLNFGPLATTAFFLRWRVIANATGDLQLDFRIMPVASAC